MVWTQAKGFLCLHAYNKPGEKTECPFTTENVLIFIMDFSLQGKGLFIGLSTWGDEGEGIFTVQEQQSVKVSEMTYLDGIKITDMLY